MPRARMTEASWSRKVRRQLCRALAAVHGSIASRLRSSCPQTLLLVLHSAASGMREALDCVEWGLQMLNGTCWSMSAVVWT